MNKIVINNNIIDDSMNKIATVENNIITFTDSGNCVMEFVNSNDINIEVVLGDNISIDLMIWGVGNKLNNSVKYILNTNSNINIEQFYCNSYVMENIVVYLDGEGSKYSHKLSSICKNEEVYDIDIYHNNNKVSSYISNKCIGFDNSKIKFNINSRLNKGNMDCVMDQNTKILTLGDAIASINPNMFIEEDSVVARHGSVISSFNPDDIFYLMSRGIDNDLAIRLLSIGFIMSNISVCEEKRKEIIEYI